MLKPYLHYCLLIVAITIPVSVVFGKATDPILERYIDLALTQNPKIAAAQSAAEAAGYRIPPAGALPLPMLNFGLKELNLKNSSLRYNDMSSKWISLEQEFPFPGMQAAKARAAKSAQSMTIAEADAARVELTQEVEMMYFQWAFWHTSEEIVRQSQALLQQTLEQTTAKYSAGLSSQADVLRAQMEIAKLDNLLSELQQKETSAVANINICCALPPGVTTTPPLPLSYEKRSFSFDSLWAWTEQNNPMARGIRAKQTEADADIKMAKLNYYPDFKVGVEYMLRGRGATADNLVSLMGGVTLPLYWKKNQQPLLHEKQIESRRVQEETRNTLNDLRFQLTDNLAQAKSLDQQIATFETQLLPQAEQVVASARAAYSTGKLEFMDLLNHQMALLDIQRDHLMKIMEYNMTWAKIEALTGQRLP